MAEGMSSGFCPCMVLVAQSLRDDLEKLLGVLLMSADARPKSMLECAYEGLRRYRLPIYWALVQLVEDVFQAICKQALLQALELPRPDGRALGRRLLRIHMVDLRPVELPPVRLPDQVYAQVRQAGERLQDRVDEAVVGGIAKADDALPLGAGAGGLIVEEEGGAEDVDEGDGGEGCAGGIRRDGGCLLWHFAALPRCRG